jgi:hypothetical protein
MFEEDSMQQTTPRFARLAISGLVAAVGILCTSGIALAQGQGQVDEQHFRCYIISQQTPQPAAEITLDDQFTSGPMSTMAGEPVMFCPPTAKSVDQDEFPIEDEQEHYALYNAPGVAVPRTVLVTDQFGTNVPWQITTPKYVMVPTAKTVVIDGEDVTFDDRENMNHYWCYEASGPRPNVRATLEDQFSGPDVVRVTRPTLFCAPAEKVHGSETFEILDENLHLACYEIHGKQKTEQHTLTAQNQFETDQWQTAAWEILCAPAAKTLPD